MKFTNGWGKIWDFFKQTTTPGTPPSTYNKLYFKSGDKLYTLGSDGTERTILGDGDTVSSLTITTADINGGTIDNTTIGATTANTACYLTDEDIMTTTGASISANQCAGKVINNSGQAADVRLYLPTAAVGYNFLVVLGTTVAKYFRLVPMPSEHIVLDGVEDTAGKYVAMTTCAVGNMIAFQAATAGASVCWFASTISGAWETE